MIKGLLNTYDYRFGDNVNSFIKFISFIDLNFRVFGDKEGDIAHRTSFMWSMEKIGSSSWTRPSDCWCFRTLEA